MSRVLRSHGERLAGPVPKALEGFSLRGVRSRRNVKLALERQPEQTVFQRFHPREPSLEGFSNIGLEGLSGPYLGRACRERLEVSLA